MKRKKGKEEHLQPLPWTVMSVLPLLQTISTLEVTAATPAEPSSGEPLSGCRKLMWFARQGMVTVTLQRQTNPAVPAGLKSA